MKSKSFVACPPYESDFFFLFSFYWAAFVWLCSFLFLPWLHVYLLCSLLYFYWLLFVCRGVGLMLSRLFFNCFFFLVLIFNDSDSTTVIHCVCKSTCANWFGLDLDKFWFCILGFELWFEMCLAVFFWTLGLNSNLLIFCIKLISLRKYNRDALVKVKNKNEMDNDEMTKCNAKHEVSRSKVESKIQLSKYQLKSINKWNIYTLEIYSAWI